MLELRHLKSILAISQTGKLSNAAKQVSLTQSALSHQIHALEDYYGLPLLTRTRAGVAFTPAGEHLLKLSRLLLREVQQTERELAQLKNESVGEELRVALECHTCYEWLMPVLDTFYTRWPQISIDLVSGFHSEPLDLLQDGKADLVIAGAQFNNKNFTSYPLFKFEILAVLAPNHPLRRLKNIQADDVQGETLITYPVAEDKIDFIREILRPAGIVLKRRTAELTLNILQLVASQRGITALPNWGVKSYVDHDYVIARHIGEQGLWSELYATTTSARAKAHYISDFIHIIREQCAQTLEGICLL